MSTKVTVRRLSRFENEVMVGSHRLTSDEPATAGGADKGPDPYGLLLAALGSCISMTLTLYADRKGWPLEGVEVRLAHEKVYQRDCEDCAQGGARMLDRISKDVRLIGPLTVDQKDRLGEISDKCPVHRTLTGTIEIVRARID